MLVEAGRSLAAFLQLSPGAGELMIPPKGLVQGTLPFLHPQSPSPRGFSEAKGTSCCTQDGCGSFQLNLSGKGALQFLSSSLPCRDSWLLSCPSLYGNFAFPHISCTGKANAKECLFICSATSLVCSTSPLPRRRSQTHHAP